jgi:Skp family chaperone for outer membrane proteins
MTRLAGSFLLAALFVLAPSLLVPRADLRAEQAAAFPDGGRIAFVDVLRIARESPDGKAAAAQLEALSARRVEELSGRLKALQARLEPGQAPADEAGRLALRREVEQSEVDLRRALRDAQSEMLDLDERLRMDFSRRLGPVIRDVATARQLHMVLPIQSAFLWAHPGLDITDEVMLKFAASRGAQPGGHQ